MGKFLGFVVLEISGWNFIASRGEGLSGTLVPFLK